MPLSTAEERTSTQSYVECFVLQNHPLDTYACRFSRGKQGAT
jgi:hypothetical protein